MPDSILQRPFVEHIGTISKFDVDAVNDKLELKILLMPQSKDHSEVEIIIRQQSILEGYGAIASILSMTKDAADLGETVICITKLEDQENILHKIGVIKK